jgi:two-component system, chemotaxis family, chemotaxis protein CheY
MIILCEDNTEQRLALRLALEQATYSVGEAANGREALDLQRKRPSPFVITDIFMPEADGFELVDAIKKEFPKTKVIVISAGGPKRTMDYLASARLIGVDATLEKPFKFESLLSTLKRLGH